MRCWSLVLVGFVSACSVSHDPSGGAGDASPVVVGADGGTVDPPEPDAAVIADAPTAEDAPPEIDGGPVDLGDPRCAPEGGPPPRFRDLYEGVIAANGCGTTCHIAGSLWAELDLSSAEVAYRSLVGVPGCGMRLRVAPCRPEESTLSVVPSQREEPCGRHTFSGGSITAEEAAQVDDWIRTGAAW